jgi:hypothetical protein
MTKTAEASRSKKQLLDMIDDLEKRPHDKVRILGDAGITMMAAGLGGAAAGTIATAAGATSIFGVTTIASWAGVTVAAATPVGWIVAGAVASGAAAYGISRLIRGGAMAEGRKAELLQRYRADAKRMAAKEQSGQITELDRTAFVVSLRELVGTDVITPESAFRLIEQVERGYVPLSQAMRLIEGLLAEKTASESGQTKANSTPSKPDGKQKADAASGNVGRENHKIFADRVESLSMGLGITSGVVAAGAGLAAPSGLSAIAVALGISSAPLIITAAPIVASVATAAGVLSGGTYFYSRWKLRKSKKVSETMT